MTPLQPGQAVNYLARAVMAAPEGELAVCTLGPMTNLAMAMTMEPRILPRLRQAVLGGGGFFQGGNATVASEYNVFVDPRAAHKVFGSGVPVTMASVDSTHTALMTPEWLQRLRGTGRRTAIEAANLADFCRRHGDHKFPTPARPIHDACATGWLLAPVLCEQRLCNVAIEIGSPDTMGRNHRPFGALEARADLEGVALFTATIPVWVEEKPFSPALDMAVRDWSRSRGPLAAEVAAADWIALLTRSFRQRGYDDESVMRARITYFHQIGHYALAFQGGAADRQHYQPIYGSVLLGPLPAAVAASKGASRSGRAAGRPWRKSPT